MPSFISISAKHLSNLAAPLSMMVIGQSMIHMKPKELIGDIRLLVFSLIKLIAIPIVGVLLLRLFVKDKEMRLEKLKTIIGLRQKLETLQNTIRAREGACVYGSPEVLEEYGRETQRLRREAADLEREIQEMEKN